MRLDCDSDALVVLVEPRGPACHTGAVSCFDGDEVEKSAAGIGDVLEELYGVVAARRREMPEGSYTTYLFEKGLNKILKKVGEEAAETIIAAKDEDAGALTAETADLVYHLVGSVGRARADARSARRGTRAQARGREVE